MQTRSSGPPSNRPARGHRRMVELTPPRFHRAYVLVGFINIATPVVVMSLVCFTAGVFASLQLVGVIEASVNQKVFTWSLLTTSTSWLVYIYVRALRPGTR